MRRVFSAATVAALIWMQMPAFGLVPTSGVPNRCVGQEIASTEGASGLRANGWEAGPNINPNGWQAGPNINPNGWQAGPNINPNG